MEVELALSTVLSSFIGDGEIRNCCCHGVVKRLDYGINVSEIALEKRFCRIVVVDEMPFCLMPERGTIDAVYLEMQEQHYAKKMLYVFCGTREIF